jgi:hypothetical protein
MSLMRNKKLQLFTRKLFSLYGSRESGFGELGKATIYLIKQGKIYNFWTLNFLLDDE